MSAAETRAQEIQTRTRIGDVIHAVMCIDLMRLPTPRHVYYVNSRSNHQAIVALLASARH